MNGLRGLRAFFRIEWGIRAGLLFGLMTGCALNEEYYEVDPMELKQVETEVQESAFETPTLVDPKSALADHKAFMDAYFTGNPDLMASTMHRMADLYMLMEVTEYERAAQLYSQRLRLYREGRLRQAPTRVYAPYRQALRLYEKIMELYPDRPENDRVLYQLARIYEARENPDKKRVMLERLVRDYNGSPFATEAQFRLAETYFEEGMFNEAAGAYISAAKGIDFAVFEKAKKGARERAETSLVEAKKREQEETALFKAGWAQIPLDNYESAVGTFQELLQRKEKILEARPFAYDPRKMTRKDWEFVQEILRGMSIAISNWIPPEKLNEYFDTVGHWTYEYLLYQKMANMHLARKRYHEAISVYEEFLDTYPLHPEAPHMVLGVVEAYQKLGLVDLSNKARLRFLDQYGEESRWFKKASLEDRNRVVPYLKLNVYHFAVFYHSEAQKTNRVRDYEEAISWYRRFLQDYPNELESSRVNFLLAEGLFETGKFQEAAREYEKTAYEYPLHKDSREAGYAAVLSREKIVGGPPEGTASGKPGPEALNLAAAAKRFAESYPSDERTLQVGLKGAQIYFRAGSYQQAREMASEVTIGYGPSQDPAVYEAQLLIASSYFEEGAYHKAAGVYRRLNISRISSEQRVEVRKLWASALYRHAEGLRKKSESEAREAFFQVQREVPGSEPAPVALYDAGLIALNQNDLEGAVQTFGLLVQEYPNAESAKKVPPMLLKTEQELLDKGKYPEAHLVAEGMKNLGHNVQGKMVYQADVMIANRYFESKEYEKALNIYRDINMSQVPPQEHVEVKRLWASALYKKAETLREQGNLKDSEEAFLQVAREVPGTEAVPVALYDAGLIALQRKDGKRAIRTFRTLIKEFPQDPNAVHAAIQIARILEADGMNREAAAEYERVSSFTQDRKLISESLLSAAWLLEQMEDWGEAKRVYNRYLQSDPGVFEKIVEVRFKILEATRRLKQDEEAQALIEGFVKQYSTLVKDDPTTGFYLAKAHLYAGDYLREKYQAVKLSEPLEENLARKKELLAAVLDQYVKSVNYEIGELVTEAAYQIGAAFEEFKTALLGSDRPKGLTPSQLEQYNFLLEEQAFPFEEKAIAALESNVRRTQELGLYDPWVKRSYQDLARLIPGRYQKEELEEIILQ